MKRSLIYIKRYRFKLIGLGLLLVLGIGLDIVFPYMSGKFVDRLIGAKSFEDISRMGIIIFLVGLINQTIKYTTTNMRKKTIEIMVFDTKLETLDHLRKISLVRYQSFNSTYLNQRINQDVTSIVEFFLDNYINFLARLIQLVIIFILLYGINSKIAVVILIISPIYYFLYKNFKLPIFNQSLTAREQTSKLFQSYNNQLEFMEEIVIESNYNIQDNKLKKDFSTYFDSILKYVKTVSRFNLIQGIFILLVQIMVFLLGGYQVITGKMTIGELTMITTYFSMIMSGIIYYIELGKNYQTTKSSLMRMEELMRIEEVKEGSISIPSLESIDANLTFSYNEQYNILEDIKITVNRGEILGIVGVNGSGKTTLSKIIIGAIKGKKDDKIQIRFNNQYMIDEIDTILLRRKSVSYVPQKIRYMDQNLSEIFNEIKTFNGVEDIKKEIEKYHIGLPEEVDSLIRKNWNNRIESLSGGDRQLILIIKNLLKDTDMIILDEPSSNIDKDRIIWLKEMLMTIKKNKIIFIISHDQQMVDIYDQVIEL